MSSVMDRCAELQKRLDHLGTVRDNQRRAEALGQHRAELEALRIELASEADAVFVLINHQHLSSADLPNPTKPLQSCAKVRQRLESDPDSLTGGRDYSYLQSRIDKVRSHLHSRSQAAWEIIVSRHEGLDQRFLRQVEQVPGQEELVEQIRQAHRALEQASAEVPRTEEAYQQFQVLSAALQDGLAALNPEDYPEAVLLFFKKAQSPRGAPLSLLTDEVLSWLQERGLYDGLRVRFEGDH